jgi:hypothetical protein
MDPVQYERIADKLMQFRGKLPKDTHVRTEIGQRAIDHMNQKIEEFLNAIDWMARLDDAGLIR